ncbi:transcriptional regulator [Saccharothrix sp. NRRL B-16348]|uniref:ATP-binding protein n=1 Tax=Saccharothrix sp. NRRL B-16348 TaxID=1415542 RepID=UPI0006AE7409|nr:tetratricopeptide repeat protein [Saccharothrix sp. NRRL B-16348]KOX15358.1 transcriptional regulator [Saccharothrix sp. NRRL B-16348]
MTQHSRQALDAFVGELTRLRRCAGSPSLNRIASSSTLIGHPLARSTVSDKLNAKSLPEWDFVVAFVRACLAHADEAGLRVPDDLADLERWDAAHWELLGAIDGDRATDRLAAAAQHEVRRRQARTRSPEADAWVVPRQLPAPVPHFAGRVGPLARLAELLAEPRHAPAMVITAIGGTAGVGKTTLAVHWANRVADRFPDGQLYVNLRGFDAVSSRVDPAVALRGFLEALGAPVERIPTDPDAQTGLYRSMLIGRRVLVVLDNARDAEQVRPLLPGSPGCLVLITSRQRLTGLVAAEGAHPIVLDLLSDAEARDVLALRLGATRVSAEPEAVRRIVAASAGLPLALAVVAARAQTFPDFPLSVLADELDAARLDGFASAEPTMDVRFVFSWSCRQLDAPTARLFRLLGLHPGGGFDRHAAASLAGQPVAETHRRLAVLAHANLVSEPSPGRYVVHDLLRAYAAEQAEAVDEAPDRHRALGRMLDHYLHAAHAADLLLYPHRDAITLPPLPDGVALPTFTGREQAWAWLTAEHQVLLNAVELAADGFDTHAWQLAWSMSTYLDRIGAWAEQSRVQHLAVAAGARQADLDAQARARRNWAVACLRRKRYAEAHEHLHLALDLYDQLGDHVGAARTVLNLGILAEQQSDFPAALGHARRAFDRFALAGHAHGQANALNNIGWYQIQLGDYESALDHCRRALVLQQEIGNTYWQAHTWDSLGSAHHHLRRHREAIRCFSQALALWRDAGERFFEATTLTHLGDSQQAVGDAGSARSAWLRAAAILDDLAHPDAGPVRARLHSAPPLTRSESDGAAALH